MASLPCRAARPGAGCLFSFIRGIVPAQAWAPGTGALALAADRSLHSAVATTATAASCVFLSVGSQRHSGDSAHALPTSSSSNRPGRAYSKQRTGAGLSHEGKSWALPVSGVYCPSLGHAYNGLSPFFDCKSVGGLCREGNKGGCPCSWYPSLSIGGVREFGGRAGGLKRQKRKRDPGVLQQTGRGHRLEFFWPRKQRLLRVPFQQNSRPSLIYDLRFRRFLCCWTSNGQYVFRPFNSRSRASGRDGGRGVGAAGAAFGHMRAGGFEAARAKALVLLRQLQRQGKLTAELESSSRTKPEINRSGVRGVYFEPEERLWVAVWKEAGIRRFRAFSVVDMGFDVAYQAAVAVRRQQLAMNYEFCMQRHRRRSGRQPLK